MQVAFNKQIKQYSVPSNKQIYASYIQIYSIAENILLKYVFLESTVLPSKCTY